MYVTLADLKLDLGIELADDSHDQYLERRLRVVSAFFDTLTERSFDQRTVTEKLSQSSGRRRLHLSEHPVTSITSISLRGSEIASADYELEDKVGFVTKTNGGYWDGTGIASYTIDGTPEVQEINEYTVVYEAGYATIPYDIQDAVVAQVSLEYYRKGNDPAISSMSVLGDSVSYNNSATTMRSPVFDAVVSKYRRMVVV